jgi:hypothetical protein
VVVSDGSLTDSETITVHVLAKPIASFTATVSFLVVNVDASASGDADGTIMSYSWNWGDGTPAGSGVTATHTYAAIGTKTITLTVTDNDGLTGLSTKQVTVNLPPPPVAAFSYTVSGMTVNVDASSSSGYGTLTYAWTWGDGTTTTETDPLASHTYGTSMASGAAVSGKARAATPGPPHGVYGYSTLLADGTPLPGCTVVLTNMRTGESITYDSTREFWDPTSEIYSVDCSEFTLVVAPAQTSWIYGDILHVQSSLGAYSGSTDAPITLNDDGNDRIDVALTAAAIVKTITLIVTDIYGQSSAPVSREVTLG